MAKAWFRLSMPPQAMICFLDMLNLALSWCSLRYSFFALAWWVWRGVTMPESTAGRARALGACVCWSQRMRCTVAGGSAQTSRVIAATGDCTWGG